MFVVWDFYWGDATYLLTLERKPIPDQSNDYTRGQLGEPVSLLGLLTGVWGRCLQERGWLEDNCITKVHPDTGGKSCSLWAPCTGCRESLQQGWSFIYLAFVYWIYRESENIPNFSFREQRGIRGKITCYQAKHLHLIPRTHMVEAEN